MTAPKKRERPAQITLVGQSDSGKTNLLATLLGNHKAMRDLEAGKDRVTKPSLTSVSDGSAADENFDKLLTYADNILRGRLWQNPGSDEVRVYQCRMTYRERTIAPARRGFLGRRPAQDADQGKEIDFRIIDGRGGDIAPDIPLSPQNPQDAEPIRRQQEYRDRLNESLGMVVVMPIDEHGFKADLARRLMNEIERTIETRRTASDLPKLKWISICYTKYDELFTHLGATAGYQALDPQNALYHLNKDGGAPKEIVTTFASLFSKAEHDGFEVRLFPVSTFGFVNGTGPANFYDLPSSPGLLTRAILPERDWADPDAPDVKDHFPFPVSENDAKTLWYPFNIAPPLFYALTGRITGPVSFSPQEAMYDTPMRAF